MANTPPDILGKIGNLPQQITDVTDSICKGASKVDSMVSRMDAAVNNATTHNSISSAIKDGLSNVTGALKTGTQKANDLASDIQSLGTKASSAITPIATAANKIQDSLEDLKNCQQVFATSSLLVNAIVGSVSGHLHSRNNEKLFSAFDSQWDSWAKGINKIYEELSPSGQANILGELAKCAFGDNVYALGSAVKNEAAGIFGGIADFEDAVHAFRGSYRNPIEAAKKIERGVKSIVSATERVANSINGMIEKYQSEMNMNPTGSKVLDCLGNLHNTRAVAAINKTLTLGGGLATLVTDVQGLQGILKSKNPKAIVAAGKKTVNDAKKIIKELKKPQAASKTVSSASSTPLGNDNAKLGSNQQGQQQQDQQLLQDQQSQNQSQQQDQRQAQQQNQSQQKNKANDIDSANADSYVCSGATMKCTFGDRQAKLTVYPDRTVFLTGQPMANVSDHTPLYNIAPFGKCHTTSFPPTGAATAAAHGKLTPMPCVPGTNSNWMNGKNDYIIKGDSALLKSSFCRCCYGGVITITDDGQRGTGSADLSRALLLPKEQLNRNAEEKSKLDVDSVLDGIQTALDFAGFIPGAGAIPDLLNAAIYAARGDMANAGMSVLAAVPGIGDAAAGAKIAAKGVKAAKKGKVANKLLGSTKKQGEPVIANKLRKSVKRKTVVLEPGSKGNWNKKLNERTSPNTDYIVGDKIYKTDEVGNVRNVSGKLELGKIDRNNYQQKRAVTIKGGKEGIDEGGHLIANMFKGAGEQINYVPMLGKELNRGQWKRMEKQWQKALSKQPPDDVSVSINVLYKANVKRPLGFVVNYTINGVPYRKKFRNYKLKH